MLTPDPRVDSSLAPVREGAPGDPESLVAGAAPSLEQLDERIAKLERLSDLLDLLAVPGLLGASAKNVFTSSYSAEDIPNEVPGVFPLERTGAGITFRWFSFPTGYDLRVPIFAGIPARVRLVTLEMGHLRTPEDFVLTPAPGVELTPLGLERVEDGAIALLARVSAATTGLCGFTLSCRRGLETGGRDTRSLGIPFVRAEYRPEL